MNSTTDDSAPVGRSANQVGGRLWFGDVRRALFTNLLAYGGRVWLLTVTAPGADVLPWDGRQVEQHAAHEWNRTAARRWRELHRRALQETGRAGHSVTRLARVWQLQSRGVLHLHLVVGVDSVEELAAARYYVHELRARAREYGFGFIDARDRDGKTGRSTLMEPERAAGYLSRYLGESAQLVQALQLAHRPHRLIWIAPALTSSTSCTMRRLRRARYLYVIRTGRSVIARAGRLPAWFGDQVELARVSGLLTVAAPAGP